MIKVPMDIDRQYPVRKSKKQKQAFRDDIQNYVSGFGYVSIVEKGSLGARNLVIGDPEKAKYLITAHYDTCAWLPFPNLITPSNFWTFLLYQLFTVIVVFGAAVLVGVIVGMITMDPKLAGVVGYLCVWIFLMIMLVGPANRHNSNDNTSGVITVLEIARTLPENLRDKVCFVLFDLEEAGLIGSSSYRSKHKKASQTQIVLNLDCVGDGDEIVFFPTGKLRKNKAAMPGFQKRIADWATKVWLCGRKALPIILRTRRISLWGSAFAPCGEVNGRVYIYPASIPQKIRSSMKPM